MRERVVRCRERQLRRQSRCNAELRHGEVGDPLKLDTEARTLLLRASERFALSARACDRIQRVARTIADLDEEDKIASRHLGEALAYRLESRAD